MQLDIKQSLNLDIFKAFKKKANTKWYNNVVDLCMIAANTLKYSNIAFYKYTFHDGIHQYNLLKIISSLLKENLKKLNELELGLLILSVYFHDIGMTYTIKELDKIESSNLFSDFLKSNIEASEMYIRKGLTISLREWYCRNMHAFRVHKYLKKYNQKLKYKGYSIRNELGYLCESHNWGANKIYEHKFDTGFLGKCDLLFLSLLLRLSDILDFDTSRAPKEIFDLLDIGEPKSIADKISKDEWQKHMNSDGFIFQPEVLLYQAKPNNPFIEQNIRNFIKWIEKELYTCNYLVKFCSTKFRDLNFPKYIDLKLIKSQEYIFGNFKFNLDTKEILNLLMGKNLYSDELVFLRELLQNSIDAIRVHQSIDKGHKGEIKINVYNRNNNETWLSFEDNGIGMTLDVITNYFFTIGKSFYKSNQFKQIQKNNNTLYSPISKFGIGVLSTFLVCQEFHLSVFSKLDNSKHRLKSNGEFDFFIVQNEQHLVKPIKDSEGKNHLFKQEYGASIFIKLKKQITIKNIRRKISNLLLLELSSTTIFLNGKKLNHTTSQEFDKTFKFSKEDLKSIPSHIDKSIFSSYSLRYIKKRIISKNKSLEGFLGVIIETPIKKNNVVEIGSKKGKLLIGHKRDITAFETFHKIDLQKKLGIDLGFFETSGLELFHNGIKTPEVLQPNDYFQLEEGEVEYLKFGTIPFHSKELKVMVNIFGENRPELNVARNAIKPFSYGLYNEITNAILTTALAIKGLEHYTWESNDIFDFIIDKNPPFINNLSSEFLSSLKNHWLDIPQFWYKDEKISLKKLINKVEKNSRNEDYKIILEFGDLGFSFHRYITRSLLDLNFTLNYDVGSSKLLLQPKKNKKFSFNNFTPLFSIPYSNSEVFYIYPLPVNHNHPFVRFIYENYNYLISTFLEFRQIMNEIMEPQLLGFSKKLIIKFSKKISKELKLKELEIGKSNFITKND